MMRYGYSMMGGWPGMMIIPVILIGVFIFLLYKKDNNSKPKDIGDNYFKYIKGKIRSWRNK